MPPLQVRRLYDLAPDGAIGVAGRVLRLNPHLACGHDYDTVGYDRTCVPMRRHKYQACVCQH